MQELSRVYLYRLIIDELEKVTEDGWMYRGELDRIIQVLNTNISMLDGIESYFTIGHEIETLDSQDLKTKLITRIENSNDQEFQVFLDRPRRKLPNKNEYIMSFKDHLYQKEKQLDAVMLFIKLLDELYEYSEKTLKGLDREVYSEIFENYFNYPTVITQVFLSYAYKDKLYSLALFHYMRKKGIFLYVDWMHSNALENGADIKVNLQKALSDSEQFLFLRTSNSELGKRETKQIRSWCSWEFGNFYGPKTSGAGDRAEEKYYIQIYSTVIKKKVKKRTVAPTIIDGLKCLSDVKGGRLIG